MSRRVNSAVRVCGRDYDLQRPSGRPSRWNALHERVLYLSEHFGAALLERLVHAGGTMPPPAHAAWLTIPDHVQVEMVRAADLPTGWDDPDDASAARRIGSAWFRSARTAILIVPSLPGRPFESNVVLNTMHPDAAALHWGAPVEVPWDSRLFT